MKSCGIGLKSLLGNMYFIKTEIIFARFPIKSVESHTSFKFCYSVLFADVGLTKLSFYKILSSIVFLLGAGVFPRNYFWASFDFLLEVRVSSYLKSDRTQFSKKKILFWNYFAKVLWKMDVGNFLHEVAATRSIKIDWNNFFW